MRKGNKQNATLNGEWAKHVRKDSKKITSGKRRMESKELTRKEKEEESSQKKESIKMNHLKRFDEFSINEEGLFDKPMDFFTGHKSFKDKGIAKEKFLKELEELVAKVKANPEMYAQSSKIDELKKTLMDQAEDNGYRGSLRVQKGRTGNKYFIIYDEKASGIQRLGGAAGSSAGSRQAP